MKTPTDEQLNLAIAKWMGWRQCDTALAHGFHLDEAWRQDDRPGVSALPNYLSDDSPRRLLNEAEARLTDAQFIQFSATLNGLWLAGNPQPVNKMGLLRTVSATARHRVIAILQTLKPEMFQ